jgi:hypothetical protein
MIGRPVTFAVTKECADLAVVKWQYTDQGTAEGAVRFGDSSPTKQIVARKDYENPTVVIATYSLDRRGGN